MATAAPSKLMAAARAVEAASKGPTNEIGSINDRRYVTGAFPQWRMLIDEFETADDLRWPQSVDMFDQMRNDPQAQALLAAMTWPIHRYKWLIAPNGARPEVVDGIAEDMGLDVQGSEPKPRGRTRGRFSHDDHLRHALLMLVWGHMFFEQVGEIDQDEKWRLRKLAPRMPRTLQTINVNPDGSLEGIRQHGMELDTQIPVDRLVAYVWQQEAGNWFGRSMLRAMFKPWFIKDRLQRIDLINHERNGSGIPVATQSEEGSPAEAAQLQAAAMNLRAGDNSGMTIPHGASMQLMGVSGSTPDTLASIRYCDEAMARSVLAMFLQLGQTESGSRALGGTFVDYFALAQEAVAKRYATITTEHVIEDWVDLNYGETENAPCLVFERDDADDASIADLSALIKDGALTVDTDLENAIRHRVKLPELAQDRPEPVAPVAPPRLTPVPDLPLAAAAGDPVPRRDPTPEEVTSGADFDRIQAEHAAAVEELVTAWLSVREEQINALATQTEQAAGDLAKLAAISAPTVGVALAADAAAAAAERGAAQVVQEAVSQGATLPAAALARVGAALVSRAEATAQGLADTLSQAARRQAIANTSEATDGLVVANRVAEHLRSLTPAYLRDQLGGLLTAGQNGGRFAQLDQAPAGTRFYGSELLDPATCPPCSVVDGRTYADMTEARNDYPVGGYFACEGGLRCRGTVVAIYADETPASVA